MMFMNKITIIVPIFNVGEYLTTCIDSLINQTLKDIEIILVDDGSTDFSPSICDRYAQIDNRVKVIHKGNGGLGSARNCGLEFATGEYVTFLDGDDYIAEDAYEILYTIATAHNLDIIRYRANRFTDEGCFSEVNKDLSLFQINEKKDIRQAALCIFSDPIFPNEKNLNFEGSLCFALMRLSIIRDNNLKCVSERIFPSEDTEFSYNIYQYITSIGKIPATFYHYRINQTSLSNTVKLDKIEKMANQCNHMIKLLERDGYPESARLYIYNFYINHSRTFISQCLNSRIPSCEKRKWIEAQSKNLLVTRIKQEFPFGRLPLINRLFFKGLADNRYWMLKSLSLLKKIKNK